MERQKIRRLLLIAQVYAPDATTLHQHFDELAEEMARRGWDVRVLTSSRAYDDPRIRFPAHETLNGVHIRRLPLSSFGKRSISLRLLAQSLFMLQAVVHGLLTPGLTAVVASTSPPFAGFGGAMIGFVRRVPFLWWVMDLNPDQMVAAGKLRARSLLVRFCDWMNRTTLQLAAKVVPLDAYMAERLVRKANVAAKMVVIPPWPLIEPPADDEQGAARLAQAGQSFRGLHDLGDRFVVMYSGNHAIQHPLDTLLDAAACLQHETRIVFVFIGAGAGKAGVERRIAAGAKNLVSLPYQPHNALEESLGAADLHVVSMGADVVGIVHPCKIYGAMAAGRPVLFFGPRESHAGAIVEPRGIGWRVEHGDVEGTIAAIHEAVAMDAETRLAIGRRAAEVVVAEISRRKLLTRMADLVDGLPMQGR
jgi:glycosyltransferase involved in cell wall biosynthesis